MKISIVIAVLDSHEIVRRQVEYFKRMDLPGSVEFIFVDDGSDPPLHVESDLRNFKLLATYDRRQWTQGLARMRGIAEARGEYIFCTDIDHIITREAIEAGIEFDGDKMLFKRRFGYLDENGVLVKDRDKVLQWGLLEAAIKDNDLSDGVHMNTWIMRKQVFVDLGGYDLKRCESGSHLQGEDRDFNHRYNEAGRAGLVKSAVGGPPIYFFPIGRFHKTGDGNPYCLFHNLEHTGWK